VDIERVRDLWPGVLDSLRESGAELLSHVLAAARPVAVEADTGVLEVGFPPSAAFNKRKAEAAEARDRVAEALHATLGARLKPAFVLLDTEPDDEDAGPPALSEDELIERFKAEFDAEEFEADEQDGEKPKEATG